MTRAIVVMAKAPIAGQAKTRLAAAIGPTTAADLHRAFLLESLATLTGLGDVSIALMCPDQQHAALLAELAPSGVRVWAQQRPGLMAGISQAFERAAAQGADAILVTETDSPSLPASHLDGCFRLLAGDRPALVLGPCDDGGYYLAGAVGLTGAAARDLFEGETYFSDSICMRTAERARALGLRVELGPAWYDVDTAQDLRRLKDELALAPDGAFPHLRQALALAPEPV